MLLHPQHLQMSTHAKHTLSAIICQHMPGTAACCICTDCCPHCTVSQSSGAAAHLESRRPCK
jgi:hypothetical protein